MLQQKQQAPVQVRVCTQYSLILHVEKEREKNIELDLVQLYGEKILFSHFLKPEMKTNETTLSREINPHILSYNIFIRTVIFYRYKLEMTHCIEPVLNKLRKRTLISDCGRAQQRWYAQNDSHG